MIRCEVINCVNKTNHSFLTTCPDHAHDCSICLDKLDGEIDDIARMVCGHQYHATCLYRWLDKSINCPLCRRVKLTG